MDRRHARWVAGRRQAHTLLPLRTTRFSSSVSCWYCELKVFYFNEPLFRFGRRYSRFLKPWFSIGVGFSFATLVGITLILLWEVASMLKLLGGASGFGNLFKSLFFRLHIPKSGIGISPYDAMYFSISSLISVCFHELGHAVCAASEGLQMEYLAFFMVVLCPGALVAFDEEFLQRLSHFSMLRIYSAGVWHNAVCCALCGLILLCLPIFLDPLYQHGQNLLVLDVSETSPFHGYLTPGNIILSLDGAPIHNLQEWKETVALIHGRTLQKTRESRFTQLYSANINGTKGYCLPTSMLEKRLKLHVLNYHEACPKELTPFAKSPMSNSSILDAFCLDAKDTVKLKKCGDGWSEPAIHGSRRVCMQNEYCLKPLLSPRMAWVEIKFCEPHDRDCLHYQNDFGLRSSEFGDMDYGGIFVFIGDVLSAANSILLSEYQPRWASGTGLYLPSALENVLLYTFNVSLILGIVNCLPVYFLDGKSILEVALCLSAVSEQKRDLIVQAYLLAGSLLSALLFLRMFLPLIF